MPQIEEGDKVSWNWGSGAPGGEVAAKKATGEIAIKSKRGNTIKKNASPDNPAVHIARSGNDVVKKASELNIEKKGAGQKRKNGDDQRDKDAEGGKGAGEGEGGLTKNEEGKDVRSGGKTGQGQGKKAKTDSGKQSNGTGTVGAKGRSKKGEETNKSAREKQPSKPRSEETVSARTRSRA